MTATTIDAGAPVPTPSSSAGVPSRDVRTLIVKAVIAVVVGAVLIAIPQTFEATDVRDVSRVITLAIAALGLNLLTGYNGQISIGHGAFMGVGAYTTGILVADYGWPHLATVPVAMALTFGIGLLVGLPALRITGLYLALVTLALATMFPQAIKRFSDFTHGTQGFRVDRFEAPESFNLESDQWAYYVLLTFAVLTFLSVRNLVKSRVGRALVAVRDNEIGAEVLGVNLSAYKVLTFGVSAMIAGLAGSLFVFNDPFVDPNLFSVNQSIFLLVAVVVGGAASIFGPVFGALFVIYTPDFIEDQGWNPALTPVFFGGVMIALMIVMPGGLIGFAKKVKGWVWSGRSTPVDALKPGSEAPGGGVETLSGAAAEVPPDSEA